jgi:hypothetical protein
MCGLRVLRGVRSLEWRCPVKKAPQAIRHFRRIARILETVGPTGVELLRVVLPVVRLVAVAAKRIREI